VAELVAPVAGSVWKVEVTLGQSVGAGQTLVILESMKMEIPVEAETAGVVKILHCAPGDVVREGQVLVEVEDSAA
jgi:acetyl-CoA carboxylase biotin carboxyl carrier protein